MKTTIFLTTLALAARVALADIPPACLLHGVNTQDQPADLKAVCGDGANDVQSYLAQNCGGNADTAQKAFIATCSSAGQSVAPYTATSGLSSPTGSSGGSGSSGSATGSGSATTSTGGAHIEHKPMGPMAAAAIALVGAVAAL